MKKQKCNVWGKTPIQWQTIIVEKNAVMILQYSKGHDHAK